MATRIIVIWKIVLKTLRNLEKIIGRRLQSLDHEENALVEINYTLLHTDLIYKMWLGNRKSHGGVSDCKSDGKLFDSASSLFLPAPADLAAKLLTLLDTVRLGMWVLQKNLCIGF